MTNDMSEVGISGLGGTNVPNQLMFPNLSQNIVETALPAQIFRQLFVQLPTQAQAVVVPIEGGSKTAVASRLGEGDEIDLDIAPISSSTVTTYKIGHGYPVTREMIQFQQAPIIQQYLKRLGMRMGNTIDYDCAQVISGSGATSTAAAGKSLGMDMTETTLAGTIGQYDIVDAISRMQVNNLFPNTLVVNPTGFSHLRKLPMYNSAMLYGEPVYQSGEMGHIEGLVVLMSQNCPSGEAYIVNGNVTASPQGQYTPMGYFCESLPIQTMMRENPQRDAYEVYAVAMYAPAVVKTDCVEILTY